MDILESMKEWDYIIIEYKWYRYKINKILKEKTFEEIKVEKENKWEQILFDDI